MKFKSSFIAIVLLALPVSSAIARVMALNSEKSFDMVGTADMDGRRQLSCREAYNWIKIPMRTPEGTELYMDATGAHGQTRYAINGRSIDECWEPAASLQEVEALLAPIKKEGLVDQLIARTASLQDQCKTGQLEETIRKIIKEELAKRGI